MADIEVQCPFCGEILEAPEELAGDTVDCPACSKSIRIEAITEEDEASCPECGEPMVEGAVLCLSGGYHTGLGRKVDTDFE